MTESRSQNIRDQDQHVQADKTLMRPPLELILGPAASGKTDAALRRLCDNPRHALLVVTSTAQSLWLAQRANAMAGAPADDTSRRIVPFSAFTSEILRHE